MLLLNTNMKKTDNIGYFNLDTGELVEKRIVKAMESEEYGRKVKNIFDKLKNCEIEELSLNEVEIALKVIGISHNNIQLDLTKDGGRYFIINDNSELILSLNIYMSGVLAKVYPLITHDNTLITRNNRPIQSFNKLREYLNISDSTWRRHIIPEIRKHNIIKSEKIDNKNYLVLNPLFSVKNRAITEYVFKCFYNELIRYLHPLQHLLLAKTYGVAVDKNIYMYKQDKNNNIHIDLID